MNRSHYATLALICIARFALEAALPFPAFASSDILGQHVVQNGETLYCIGRGYGVVPSAIAEANGLSAFARLSVGQVLKIPAVQWVNFPPGRVCAPQFLSPFGGVLTATPTPPTAIPTATVTPSQGVGGQTYTVRGGDNLFRIGLRFGVTVNTLKAVNGLRGNTIYVGQVLFIPGKSCDSSYPTVCIPPPPPDLDCNEIPYRDFQVLSLDPHGFDADRDGIGCENVSLPPPSGNCDPSYPTLCLPPNLPDLDCVDMLPYTDFPVLPPDPHRFDGDHDGIGCES